MCTKTQTLMLTHYVPSSSTAYITLAPPET
jgi:hypothetical protein